MRSVKVSRLFYRFLPLGSGQSERFPAAASGCPLETLHAEQQNGRPSTDWLHSALKFKFFCTSAFRRGTLVLICKPVAYYFLVFSSFSAYLTLRSGVQVLVASTNAWKRESSHWSTLAKLASRLVNLHMWFLRWVAGAADNCWFGLEMVCIQKYRSCQRKAVLVALLTPLAAASSRCQEPSLCVAERYSRSRGSAFCVCWYQLTEPNTG